MPTSYPAPAPNGRWNMEQGAICISAAPFPGPLSVFLVRRSPFHHVRFVHVGGLAVAEEAQDDRQREADFGGGDDDHEDREDDAGELLRVEVDGEGDKLMLTACSISSTDIRISTALRRASTPYIPIEKRIALRTRKWLIGIIRPPRRGPGRSRRSAPPSARATRSRRARPTS